MNKKAVKPDKGEGNTSFLNRVTFSFMMMVDKIEVN